MEFLIYPLCGVLAGLLAGLFGVGGGLVVVPVLASVFTWQALAPAYTMQLALGTSLTTIVATSLSSGLAHHQRGGVRWDYFLRLAPGIMCGTWIGAGLADLISTEMLQRFLGVVEIGLAIYLWTRRDVATTAQESALRLGPVALAGVGIGSGSSLAGIGGGTLTVPYLLSRGLAMTQAVGTSAACGLPIAVFGSLSYAYWGWGAVDLPPHAWGYVYWPAAVGIMLTSVLCAPLGAKFAHLWPQRRLRHAFALLLAIMGSKMLFF